MAATLALAATAAVCASAPPPASAAGSTAPQLRIVGNQFVTAAGAPLRLFAVHFGGPEYSCVQPLYTADRNSGVFDHPTGDADFEAIRSWHANTIRIPLNEQCWLGVNPVRRHGGPSFGITPLTGQAGQRAGARLRTHYRSTVSAIVARAHRHGLAVILDLHWSAAGDAIAWGQWPLPDRQYSIPFWRSVATTFKRDRSVAFELFNEPFMRNLRTGALTLTWHCLRDGCVVPNHCADCGLARDHRGDLNLRGCGARCPTEDNRRGSYRSAGTQSLVNAIRATGARQPILVPGRDYTNDLAFWHTYLPRDPLHQLAASFHAYEGLPCASEACWSAALSGVANAPVVTTEFGGDTTGQSQPCPGVVVFDTRFMNWADQLGVSYGGFAWSVDYVDNPIPTCSYDLLDTYSGTPRYGQGQTIHDHFAAVAPAP
jgi:hypothetical protein